jgi:hypothetical protein
MPESYFAALEEAEQESTPKRYHSIQWQPRRVYLPSLLPVRSF